MDAQIGDLAPTILHLAGIPVPADLDGRVVAEALDAGWLAAHPVQIAETSVTTSPTATTNIYSDEEEALLAKHLAALGYL